MRKRLFSGILSLCLIASVFLPVMPVYAKMTSHNTAGGAGSNSSAGNWAWTYSQWTAGYKLSLIFNSDGPIDTSLSTLSGKNKILTTVVSLASSDMFDCNMIDTTPVWDQSVPIGAGYDTNDEMKGAFDNDTQTLAVTGPARESLLIPVSTLKRTADKEDVFSQKSILFDGSCTIWNTIAHSPVAGGTSEVLRSRFIDENQLTQDIFALVKTAYEDGDAGLANAIWQKLSPSLQDEITKQAGSSDGEDLVPYIFPEYDDTCLVGWAIIVEPMYQLVFNGDVHIYIDDRYKNFVGTATHWANLMGATAALANEAVSTYNDPATNMDVADAWYESMGGWIDYTNAGGNGYIWYGAFKDAHTPIEGDMPNSVYTVEGWLKIPVASVPGGTYTPEQVLNGGAGVGVYIREPNIPPEAPPCCYPASPTDDPCPCGGPVPCKCPPGCTCDPDNYTEGCDCVDPPPELQDTGNPIIHEDHLTERLEKDVTSTNSPKTFTVAYKPEYSAGPRHYRDDNKEFWKDYGTTYYYTCGYSGPDSTHAAYCPLHCSCYNTESNKELFYHNWHVYENYKYVWEAGQQFAGSIPSANLTTYSKMKSESEALELLKNGDRAQIKWNGHIDDTFTETDPNQTTSRGDLYEGSNHVTWISHRFAVNGTARNAVWLSKYMTQFETTKANDKYKNAMTSTGFGGTLETTNGKDITESLENTEGTFNLDFHVGNNESIKGAYASENATYKFQSLGTYPVQTDDTQGSPASCGMGSPQSVDMSIVRDALTTVTLNQANFSIDIDVQGTYAGLSKKQTLYNEDPKVTVSGNGNVWTFTTPSSLFSFYPSYKMKAIYDVNGSDQDVWCLSRRMRFFRGEDKLVITVNSAGGNIESSWSRDYGDPEYTTKAGNAYQYTGNGGTVTFDGYFHILDPDFALDPSEQAQRNADIVASYVDQLSAVMASISEDSVGIYSNLPYAAYNSIYAPKLTGYAGKNEGREGMILKSASASGGLGGTTYSFLPGYNGAQTSGRSNGASVSGDALNNGFLTGNLETGGGILVSGWYNEDFEGIIQVHVTATVNVGAVKPEMAIVDEHLSDFQTAINALAQPITVDTGVGAFTKARGQFAIGVECNIGPVSWGGASANVVAMFDPVTFNVRGSSYDQAD